MRGKGVAREVSGSVETQRPALRFADIHLDRRGLPRARTDVEKRGQGPLGEEG